MRKAIGIIILGLLLSSNAFAAIAPGMFGTKYILHEFTGQERGLIHLRPARKTLEGTLEFRYISKMFEGHLMQHGFKNTSDESKAQYIGLINYGLVTDGVYSTTYDMKIDNKIGHSIISEASEYLLMPPKRKLFGKNKYTRVMELNIYGTLRKLLDSKRMEYFGFRPTISLKDGLINTYQDYKKNWLNYN